METCCQKRTHQLRSIKYYTSPRSTFIYQMFHLCIKSSTCIIKCYFKCFTSSCSICIYQKVHVHYQMFYLFLFHVFNQRLEPAFCVNLQRCWGKNELIYYLILKIKKQKSELEVALKKAFENFINQPMLI